MKICGTLTLVLILYFASLPPVLAATEAPSPEYVEPLPPSEKPIDMSDRSKTELTDIAQPPPPRPQQEVRGEYFYRFRWSMSPRLGVAYDTKYYADKTQPLYHLGFLFLFSTKSLKAYEAGVDWNGDSNGAFHFAQRWIHSNTRFRPYTKAGLGMRVVPEENLATFVEYRYVQLRAAAGFEHLITAPMSVRVELELIASVHSQTALFTLGYSWAW